MVLCEKERDGNVSLAVPFLFSNIFLFFNPKKQKKKEDNDVRQMLLNLQVYNFLYELVDWWFIYNKSGFTIIDVGSQFKAQVQNVWSLGLMSPIQ